MAFENLKPTLKNILPRAKPQLLHLTKEYHELRPSVQMPRIIEAIYHSNHYNVYLCI